ncbi:hypothetical protein [Microbacterium sp. SA39]|uniref:hypothetical protein n=1 Tax=Microbacterium sp. SA39 TaxID=1263625 RepID=UPI0005FA173C|nr:hypothetical protein [Microbacterium sp. SA39]
MEMTEPQVWTLIGVFAAVMIGAISLLLRQNDKIITSFRHEIAARFEGLEGKMDVRFDAMDRRLEELDKEVTNLATRFWRSQ